MGRAARSGLALALAVGAAAAGCSGAADRGNGERSDSGNDTLMTTRPTIEEVQEARTAQWMALDEVVGTGIGACEGEPCIKVFVRRDTPEVREAIPDTVEGYAVRLEVTGRFEARP